MIDVRAIEAATGWRLVHLPASASTNDEAARLRDGGAPARTAFLADRQTAGRGRGGRTFSSPEGGLYLSVLLAAEPRDLPGPLTAAVALAATQAVEDVAPLRVSIKWPNDLWIRGLKVGGILLESSGQGSLVVAGIGMNLQGVPPDLPGDVRATLTALDLEAGRPVERGPLVERILSRIDERLLDLSTPAGRARVAEAWRERLALRGERITYVHAGKTRAGLLLDATLDEGLRIADDAEGAVVRRPEHVQDVRPA